MSHRTMAAMTLLMMLGFTSIADGARRPSESPQPVSVSPGHPLGQPSTPIRAHQTLAAPDTLTLGEWDFDNALLPDPQGWTTQDVDAQVGTFFHVDDFAGLGGGTFGGLLPLAGARSLWCGTRTSTDPYDAYATLPGYGNSWEQRFESRAFPVTGAVTVDFRVHYDSEPSYDFTQFEYRSKTGTWRKLLQFEGRGGSLATAIVPADSLAGSVRLRFRFTSDNSWSDEDGARDSDGAVIIDSLTVRDVGGVVDFQDFEGEAVGALSTADGDWAASMGPAFGNFAALFDGSAVLQQDPLVTNHTHLWGFFNGSTDTYACGGHPGQLAVPLKRVIEGQVRAIDNRVVSPPISITEDIHGTPVVDPAWIMLEFDVYRDLLEDRLVYYVPFVRSITGSNAADWKPIGGLHDGPSPGDWFRFQANIVNLIDPGATHIQVALGVLDMCPFWCGIVGLGTCHTDAPLFDNVRVVADAGTSTGVNPSPGIPDRLALHQNVPNPFNPTTTIVYDVPAGGADVTIVIYDVAGRRVRTLVNEHKGPGHYQALWDGRTESGQNATTGVYFYRMVAGSFAQSRKTVLLK